MSEIRGVLLRRPFVAVGSALSARSALSALSALLALSACDDDAISSAALIAVDPAAIDYGAVPTGQTRTRTVHLSNRSPTATLRVTGVAIAEGSSPAFHVESLSIALAPAEETTFEVGYTADDAEPDAGFVEIMSDAESAPITRIALSSARTFPKIEVFPERLELGALASGDRATRTLEVKSIGDASLTIARVSLRTEGFAGEACARDADCREGRCTRSRNGTICATSCANNEACASGYSCTDGLDGLRACREDASTAPKRSGRGFSIDPAELKAGDLLLPASSRTVTVVYQPGAGDRGAAELWIESDDADRPAVGVPLFGRPENLPPIAVASIPGGAPALIQPGTRVSLSSAGSSDPEGSELRFAWRFVTRPEGSRAAFEDAFAEQTAFTVDLPGRYVALLEARDDRSLASTNDARVTIDATAGQRIRMTLSWNRTEADLDLHFVSPGAPVGSLGDCFYENPTPDWAPIGPGGDPVLTATTAEETITVEAPAGGVYTLTVAAIAPATSGPTMATLSIYLEDVAAARFDAVLSPSSESWDVATLTWPSGLLTALGTIR